MGAITGYMMDTRHLFVSFAYAACRSATVPPPYIALCRVVIKRRCYKSLVEDEYRSVLSSPRNRRPFVDEVLIAISGLATLFKTRRSDQLIHRLMS